MCVYIYIYTYIHTHKYIHISWVGEGQAGSSWEGGGPATWLLGRTDASSSTLYYAILYYTIMLYTILYYDILYYTILYYTMLCYAILYYTILYYTIAVLYLRRRRRSTKTSSCRCSRPSRPRTLCQRIHIRTLCCAGHFQ